ncbi:MAG: WbqC family protein [Bacteroidia bacterium]|nr:WbqC family protein [Bacteroidia bacterium]
MADKVVVVMQPTFAPWLGYFDLIDQADVFVFYDNVQFVKSSWQSRNRINTHQGELFLTIPVHQTHRNTNINEIEIFYGNNWKKKMLRTLHLTYNKSKYFQEVYNFIESHFDFNYSKISDFNIELIKKICQKIGIRTQLVKSSDINLYATDRTEKLIELTQKHNGNIYLSTLGSSAYLSVENAEERFKQKGISLIYHHYIPVEYPVVTGKFLPYMSILDCLFNCGFDKTIEIVRAGRRPSLTPLQLAKS